jgi:hypothetical protein
LVSEGWEPSRLLSRELVKTGEAHASGGGVSDLMRIRASLLAVLVAGSSLLLCACTSAQTDIVGPSSDGKCQISAVGSPVSFTADGGTGTLQISTERDCTWSLGSSAPWLSINGNPSGQGSASVAYAVAPNPVPSARGAALTVGSLSVQIGQAAAPCRFELSRSQDAIGSSGGSLTVNVTTLAGCSWTAVSNASWIAVTSGQNGSGNGTVGVVVSTNSAAAQRTGSVSIAGQTYTVTQTAQGAPNPPTDGVTPPPSTPGGSVDFVGIVGNVSGKCPNLTFSAGGYTVVTDKHTRFREISCGDVSNGGRAVEVQGDLDTNGVVNANQVTKADN